MHTRKCTEPESGSKKLSPAITISDDSDEEDEENETEQAAETDGSTNERSFLKWVDQYRGRKSPVVAERSGKKSATRRARRQQDESSYIKEEDSE